MITWLQIQNSRERSQLEKHIWEASAYERYVKKYLFSQISWPFPVGLLKLNLPNSCCPISSSISSVLSLAPFLRKGNYSLSQHLTPSLIFQSLLNTFFRYTKDSMDEDTVSSERSSRSPCLGFLVCEWG